jgi:hypothetical protein
MKRMFRASWSLLALSGTLACWLLHPGVFREAAAQPTYVPTPANEAFVRRFVADNLEFMLLHEMGHMMIQETKQRLLGPEEYMADAFAAAVLTSGSRGADDRNPLVSVAQFWNQVHNDAQARNPGHYNWADIHGQPAQRAYMAVCILYASDPAKWIGFARSLGLTEKQMQVCVGEASRNKQDWSSVIAEKLNTGTPAYQIIAPVFSPNVAVFLNQVDSSLPAEIHGSLSNGRRLTDDSKALDIVARAIKRMRTPLHATIHTKAIPGADVQSLQRNVQHPRQADPNLYDYNVVGDSCLDKKGQPVDNAYWDRTSRSIILCYALVNAVEDIGRQIASAPRK